jgi:exosortase O
MDARSRATLALGWTLLALIFREPLTWLAGSLGVPEYRMHSWLLSGIAAFVFLKAWKGSYRSPRWRPGPALILLFGLGGSFVSKAWLGIRIDLLDCLFMSVSAFGQLGFILEPSSWRRSAVALLLFFVCLPLGYHAETFLGFPLRVFSARAAAAILGGLGQAVQSTETILFIENRYAHIDLPCSGVKGLWAVTLFSLLLSLLERYRVSLAWAFSLAAGWVFVGLANIFRVVALVSLGSSSFPPVVKSAAHAPIGLVGFLLACGLAYLLHRALCVKAAVEPVPEPERFRASPRAHRFALVAVLVIAAGASATAGTGGIRPAPAEAGVAVEPPRAVEIDTTDEGVALALSPAEKGLFLGNGVDAYLKRRFSFAGASGTVFVVRSRSWRAHHHPEQCLQAQGRTIRSSRALVIDGQPVREVELKDGSARVYYWFQSRSGITDDYGSLVWSGLVRPGTSFSMVSLSVEAESGRFPAPADLERLILHHRALATHVLNSNPGESPGEYYE